MKVKETRTLTGSGENQGVALTDLLNNFAEYLVNNDSNMQAYKTLSDGVAIQHEDLQDIMLCLYVASGIMYSVVASKDKIDEATSINSMDKLISTRMDTTWNPANYIAELTLTNIRNEKNVLIMTKSSNLNSFPIAFLQDNEGKMHLTSGKLSNKQICYNTSDNLSRIYNIASEEINMETDDIIFITNARLLYAAENTMKTVYLQNIYAVIGNNLNTGMEYLIKNEKYFALNDKFMFKLGEE